MIWFEISQYMNHVKQLKK